MGICFKINPFILEHVYKYIKKIKAKFVLGNALQNSVLRLLKHFYLHGTGKRLLLHNPEIIWSGFSCNLHSVTRGQCLLQEYSGINLKLLQGICSSGVTIVVFINKLKPVCIICYFCYVSLANSKTPGREFYTYRRILDFSWGQRAYSR